MSDQPRVWRCAVLVVNYGSSELLRANLVRVSKADPSLAIYVLDNTAQAEERERVGRLATLHGWTALFPEQNLGFGGGCNVAAARAFEDGADQILLLNPDAYLDPVSLQSLREIVTENPRVLAGPSIMTPTGGTWSAGVDLLLDTGDMRGWSRRANGPPPRSMAWLSGACMLLSRQLWQKVGGFDPDYFLYWEDVDLCARVWREGGEVVLMPEAVALHDEGATHRSVGTRVKSPIYYFYNVRNRMLFASKHLEPETVARWRRSSVWAAYQVLLRGGRRQFLRPQRSIWPAWRGLTAGWRLSSARQPALVDAGREATS